MENATSKSGSKPKALGFEIPGSFRATLVPGGVTAEFATGSNAGDRERSRFKKCVVTEGRAEKRENDSEALPILSEHILLGACVCFLFCFWVFRATGTFPIG